MRTKAVIPTFTTRPNSLNRPVRPLPDREYRLSWARDLSRDNNLPLGVNVAKVDRLLMLPLLEVLVWGGTEGIERAESMARQRKAA